MAVNFLIFCFSGKVFLSEQQNLWIKYWWFSFSVLHILFSPGLQLFSRAIYCYLYSGVPLCESHFYFFCAFTALFAFDFWHFHFTVSLWKVQFALNLYKDLWEYMHLIVYSSFSEVGSQSSAYCFKIKVIPDLLLSLFFSLCPPTTSTRTSSNSHNANITYPGGVTLFTSLYFKNLVTPFNFMDQFWLEKYIHLHVDLKVGWVRVEFQTWDKSQQSSSLDAIWAEVKITKNVPIALVAFLFSDNQGFWNV